MHYSFTAFGHPNILATHPTTLEITKAKNVTKKGDCIIAVNADFSLQKIKEIIKDKKNILVKLKIDNSIEEIHAEINEHFNDDHELILRKTNFVSERTLGIYASKSSLEFSRDFVNRIKNPQQVISVKLEAY